ncbi:MAG TPA: hypothetical protein DCQ31_14470, partial [Bacteroidales bacterium]|nr:hypothetical protein [Bacteroidales bacterium]
MSFNLLIIGKLYKEFCTVYQEKFSHLANESYAVQYEHLSEKSLELITSYAANFNAIGIATQAIITNLDPLQKKWAQEHGFFNKTNEEIVAEQIKYSKPTAIWIDDLDYVKPEFISYIKSTVPSVKLIFAYHCAPYTQVLASYFKNVDFVLTCTPAFKTNYEKLGLKSHFVYHAFDSNVLNKLKEVKPENEKSELVFTGSFYLGGEFHN